MGSKTAGKILPLPGRLAMKLLRVLSRIAILSLAAAASIGLTQIYGGSVRFPLPGPSSQAERLNRPSLPQLRQLPEVLADGMVLAIFALAGRVLFRLRLSSVPRGEGQLILLDLQPTANSRQQE
jgi:hypothetical protein